jgi:hypothetical protein
MRAIGDAAAVIGGRRAGDARRQGGSEVAGWGCSLSEVAGARSLPLPQVLQLASAAMAGLGRARVAGSALPVAGEGGGAVGEAASRRSMRHRGEEERVEESAWRTPAAAAIAQIEAWIECRCCELASTAPGLLLRSRWGGRRKRERVGGGRRGGGGPATVGMQRQGDTPRNAHAGGAIAFCSTSSSSCWSCYSSILLLILQMQTVLE